jgi:hypothetical protein
MLSVEGENDMRKFDVTVCHEITGTSISYYVEAKSVSDARDILDKTVGMKNYYISKFIEIF